MDSSDLDILPIHGSLDPQVSPSNGISIDSAVFAQHIRVTTQTDTQTTLRAISLATGRVTCTCVQTTRPNKSRHYQWEGTFTQYETQADRLTAECCRSSSLKSETVSFSSANNRSTRTVAIECVGLFWVWIQSIQQCCKVKLNNFNI